MRSTYSYSAQSSKQQEFSAFFCDFTNWLLTSVDFSSINAVVNNNWFLSLWRLANSWVYCKEYLNAGEWEKIMFCELSLYIVSFIESFKS